MKIAVLIMAAGESRRMGDQIKQLMAWKGTDLINNAITTAANTKADSVKVILGAYAGKIKKSIPAEVGTYICESWKEGLGTSIGYGIRQVLEDKPDKILIMLGDQPFIKTSFLNNLIQRSATSDKLIIATGYAAKAGVPAVFDKNLFPELVLLQGSSGAKKIIEKYKVETEIVDNPDALKDIDTIKDYNNYHFAY